MLNNTFASHEPEFGGGVMLKGISPSDDMVPKSTTIGAASALEGAATTVKAKTAAPVAKIFDGFFINFLLTRGSNKLLFLLSNLQGRSSIATWQKAICL
jgi:hypothetical protein